MTFAIDKHLICTECLHDGYHQYKSVNLLAQSKSDLNFTWCNELQNTASWQGCTCEYNYTSKL